VVSCGAIAGAIRSERTEGIADRRAAPLGSAHYLSVAAFT